MERRNGEGKLTGGRPSKLLVIFIPPAEKLKEREGKNAAETTERQSEFVINH